MKTEKEKAEELVMQFMKLIPKDGWTQEIHKQCALMCVDEIIEVLMKERMCDCEYILDVEANHWEDIRKEIEKL
jgi:hypothetical protein